MRVLANDPYFKAALAERDQATTLDSLGERGQDLGADFMLATDPGGVLVARSDRPCNGRPPFGRPDRAPRARRRGLRDPLAPGRPAVHPVAVPMQTGPDLVGVLVAGYGLDEAVAPRSGG